MVTNLGGRRDTLRYLGSNELAGGDLLAQRSVGGGHKGLHHHQSDIIYRDFCPQVLTKRGLK